MSAGYRNPQTRNRIWYTAHGYALATTLTRLFRHKLATATTLLVIAVSLSLPVLIVFLTPQLSSLSKAPLKSLSMTLYLDGEVSDEDAAAMAQRLNQQQDISDARYISRQEALTTLRENTSLSPAIDILGVNPLPAAIVVQPATQLPDRQLQQALADKLSEMPGVNDIQLDLEWVARMQSIGVLLNRVAWLMGLILVIASLMVIANTIRLELLRHAKESEVVSLLGGTPRFIRRPFLYLGATFGMLGALLASLIAIGLLFSLNIPIRQLAESYASSFELSLPNMHYMAYIVLFSLAAGIVAAVLTVRFQLSTKS